MALFCGYKLELEGGRIGQRMRRGEGREGESEDIGREGRESKRDVRGKEGREGCKERNRKGRERDEDIMARHHSSGEGKKEKKEQRPSSYSGPPHRITATRAINPSHNSFSPVYLMCRSWVSLSVPAQDLRFEAGTCAVCRWW